jgi:hypothetical protein
MPEQTPAEPAADSKVDTPEEYGTLTIEDEGAETVDPADVAGTANDSDDDVVYAPTYSEADEDSSDTQ